MTRWMVPRSTCTSPQKNGETRTFQYGSRATNPIDQWPDPDIYTHKSSGQTLSGSETRNLNRCYPGVEDGTLSEQVAYAVTNMIKTLDIDMAQIGRAHV